VKNSKDSLVLKVKSVIYKYFGIYLAHREENEYLSSKEYWDKFINVTVDPDNDMSPRNVHGLLVGSWQADHGFSRMVSFLRFGGPFRKVLAWFVDFYMNVKWDLRFLLLRLFK
jgi:hypothetical protein